MVRGGSRAVRTRIASSLDSLCWAHPVKNLEARSHRKLVNSQITECSRLDSSHLSLLTSHLSPPPAYLVQPVYSLTLSRVINLTGMRMMFFSGFLPCMIA